MADGPFYLDLISDTGRLDAASVSVTVTTEGSMAVTLQWTGGELVEAAYDAFTAFSTMRERLARLGLTPRCFGACRNLVLSSMACQMSRGLKGYLVCLGKAAQRSDLVRIFDAGSDMDLATVAEQKEFKREWLRSLRFGDEQAKATLDDLYRTPEKAELIGGRIVKLPMNGLKESRIIGRLCRSLDDHATITKIGGSIREPTRLRSCHSAFGSGIVLAGRILPPWTVSPESDAVYRGCPAFRRRSPQ